MPIFSTFNLLVSCKRVEKEPQPLPRLALNPQVQALDAFRYEDIAIEGYAPLPAIKAPVAV